MKCREKEGKGDEWERTKKKRKGGEGRGMTWENEKRERREVWKGKRGEVEEWERKSGKGNVARKGRNKNDGERNERMRKLTVQEQLRPSGGEGRLKVGEGIYEVSIFIKRVASRTHHLHLH